MKNERKRMEIPEREKGEEASDKKAIQTKENIKDSIIDMVNLISEEKDEQKLIYIQGVAKEISENNRYLTLIYELVTRKKHRAKETYYLLAGFLGSNR